MDQAGKPVLDEVGPAADRLRRWERAGIVALILALVGVGSVTEIRSAFQNRRKGDLDVFLRAGWAVRSGADLYDVTDNNGFHYHYPPFFAILMAPLADPPAGADRTGMLPFAVSVAACYVLNLLCLALAAHLLARALEKSGAVPPGTPGGRRWWALRLWPVLVCAIPIGHTLIRGQVNLLILALLCGSLAAVLGRRPFRAGLWLAAAIAIKIIPAFLLVFPLWRRDGRFLAGCAAGLVVALVVVPLGVMGPTRTWFCYSRLTNSLIRPGLGAGGDDSRAEELTNVTATDSQSVLAVLHNSLHLQRHTRPDRASREVRLASYAICGLLTLATLAAAGRRPSRDPLCITLLWGGLILVMLLASPVCHLHYFTLAVPLATGLLLARWQGQRVLYPGAAPIVLFVTFGVANLLPHLSTAPNLLWFLWTWPNPLSFPPSLQVLRDAGAALYGALALWAAGIVVLWRRTRRAPRAAASAGRLAAA
jgi:alpha-1,2-mannosyltransferase